MLFGLGWVVGPGLGCSALGWVVGAKGEVSTAAAHASGRPPSVFLASPPSKACAMSSRLLRGLAHLSRCCEDATRHGRSCRGVEP